MVGRMTSNAALQEDLVQEALVHLWLIENHRPGQTRSWYWQSCKFHLQHYLGSGRSVDSRKRHHAQLELSPEGEVFNQLVEIAIAESSFLSQVNANDICSVLAKQLNPREQAVLTCLADGLGVRDIARRLRISHPTAIKYRRKIAALAVKLGITPPESSNGRGQTCRSLPRESLHRILPSSRQSEAA